MAAPCTRSFRCAPFDTQERPKRNREILETIRKDKHANALLEMCLNDAKLGRMLLPRRVSVTSFACGPCSACQVHP